MVWGGDWENLTWLSLLTSPSPPTCFTLIGLLFLLCAYNLVPRAHVSFGQRQDTELWNNPFPDSKILGLPVSRRMRALA